VSLKKNIVANYIGAGWTALMNLAFIPMYIRYLGMESYGLISIFAMLQGFLSLLDLGMAPTISREMARLRRGIEDNRSARNLLRSVEIVAACVAFIMMFGFWLASSWLANDWFVVKNLPIHVVVRALTIMGGLIGLRIIENIYRSALVGLQRQVLLNVIISFTATLRGLGAVAVLVLLSNSIQAFFFWQLLVSVIGVGLMAAATYPLLRDADGKVATFSVRALKEIRHFAAGTMAITCLSLLLTNMDKILLSRLLPLQAFGYYAFAVVVAQAPLGFVAPVAQAFYPRFTYLHSHGSQSGLVAAYHSAAQLITVLLGSAAAFIILFAPEVLEVWTRNVELSERTYALVLVLSVGTLCNGLMTIPYFLQLSSAWTGLTIRVNLVAISLVVPALLFFVPKYGAMAAAWVWLTLNASYVVVVIPFMHRRILPNEKWHWYIRDVAIPLAAVFAIGVLLRFLFPAYLEERQKIVALAGCATLLILVAVSAAPIIRGQVLKILGWNNGTT